MQGNHSSRLSITRDPRGAESDRIALAASSDCPEGLSVSDRFYRPARLRYGMGFCQNAASGTASDGCPRSRDSLGRLERTDAPISRVRLAIQRESLHVRLHRGPHAGVDGLLGDFCRRSLLLPKRFPKPLSRKRRAEHATIAKNIG